MRWLYILLLVLTVVINCQGLSGSKKGGSLEIGRDFLNWKGVLRFEVSFETGREF